MLENLFQQLNQEHFGGALPLPRLLWNSRLRSSAGRFSPAKKNPLIEVASYLQELPEAQKHIRDTLLHEMVHYYLWHKERPYGHTPEFHRILKRVGASRYNTVPKTTGIKYWYECRHCQKKVPARRKLGAVACLECCKKWNKGYFSARFLLEISAPPEKEPDKRVAPLLLETPPLDQTLPFAEVSALLLSLKEQIKKAMPKKAPPSS